MQVERKVLVPVSREYVGEVLALLDRLEARDQSVNGAAAGIAQAGGTEERSRSEFIRLVFDDCAPGTRKIFLELAEHGGDKIYGYDLARVANPEGTSINTSPYFKSYNKAFHRHKKEGDERIILANRGRDRLFYFWLEERDAEIVRGFEQ